jgi:hypothetical protein
MAILFPTPCLAGVFRLDRARRLRASIHFTAALLVLVSSTAAASGWPFKAKSPGTPKGFETATVVETAQTISCSGSCTAFAEPATAFCFRMGDQVKFADMDEIAGKEVLIRVSRLWIWLRPPGGSEVRLTHGSRFEEFKDAGCVREVHKPILATANGEKRRAKVPAAAMAIVGPDKGDSPQLFLWYACAMNSDAATIACRRWYRNGDEASKDWYCAQTLNGAPVKADFAIDPTLSQAGRLVLTSGAVLKHDGRSRINDALERPGEACF